MDRRSFLGAFAGGALGAGAVIAAEKFHWFDKLTTPAKLEQQVTNPHSWTENLPRSTKELRLDGIVSHSLYSQDTLARGEICKVICPSVDCFYTNDGGAAFRAPHFEYATHYTTLGNTTIPSIFRSYSEGVLSELHKQMTSQDFMRLKEEIYGFRYFYVLNAGNVPGAATLEISSAGVSTFQKPAIPFTWTMKFTTDASARLIRVNHVENPFNPRTPQFAAKNMGMEVLEQEDLPWNSTGLKLPYSSTKNYQPLYESFLRCIEKVEAARR